MPCRHAAISTTSLSAKVDCHWLNFQFATGGFHTWIKSYGIYFFTAANEYQMNTCSDSILYEGLIACWAVNWGDDKKNACCNITEYCTLFYGAWLTLYSNATKSIPDGISAASPIFSCYISQVEMRPYTCLRTAVKSAIGIVFNFPLQANRHAIVEWSYGGAMCYIRKRLSTVGHAWW
jgi:hypothetical protein